MSESSVLCRHDKVVRRGETWHCDWCEAKFYHLEDIGFPGQKLQVMEPMATLRDQFAMAAMNGIMMVLKHDLLEGIPDGAVARTAYAIADDMLEARK